MPKIVIWMPHDVNDAGHVAIATDEYYVSFWPARCLEKGKVTRTISNGIEFALEVHKGRLVFNQDFDKIDEDDPNKEYEGDCDPIEYQIDAAHVSNEDVNAEIEEFLRYNEIDPKDVTLAKGKEKYREFKQLAASLPQEEAKLIKDDQKPVKSLAETKYSILTELVSSKKDDDSVSFYNSQQSCVSFAFNLVQMAWLKLHPDRPIPIVNYEEAKNAKDIPLSYIVGVGISSLLSDQIPKKFPYKVPWFEKEVVRRYLITGSKVNNKPIIPAQLEIENFLRQLKPTLVSTFVLLLLGFFFPDTAYPNLLIFWNFVGENEVIADDPSIVSDFIFPLLLILLAHHSWCGVFLSVVIYYVGDFSYDIMKSYRSGEFGGGRNRFLVETLSATRRFGEEIIEHNRVVFGREPESPVTRVDLVKMLIDYWRAH